MPFQVSGGLAAKMYGSPRPLYDLDFDVREEDLRRIRDLFRARVARDIYHHVDEHHDTLLLTLNIGGVLVDFAPIENYYVAGRDGQKVLAVSSLSKAKPMKLGDLEVPVIDQDELIAYKKILQRPEDLADIAAIS